MFWSCTMGVGKAVGMLYNNVHVVDNIVHCTLGNCWESEFYFCVCGQKNNNKKKRDYTIGIYYLYIKPY